MSEHNCKVDASPVWHRVLHEELAVGHTQEFVAEYITAKGFPLSESTLKRHVAACDGVPSLPKSGGGRDLAVLVSDEVARVMQDPSFDILDKTHQGAVKVGLTATNLLDRREREKTRQLGQGLALMELLARLRAAPVEQLTEGEVIEGTAREV